MKMNRPPLTEITEEQESKASSSISSSKLATVYNENYNVMVEPKMPSRAQDYKTEGAI